MYQSWLNRKLAFSPFKSERLFVIVSHVVGFSLKIYVVIIFIIPCNVIQLGLWNALVCQSISGIRCYYTIIILGLLSLKWSHYRFSLLKDGILLVWHMRSMALIDWLTREKCFMMNRILPSIFHIFPSPPWTLTCYILRSRQQHPVLLPTIRWDWYDG